MEVGSGSVDDSADTRPPALEVKDLSVGFDRTTVIERLSFEVPHGRRARDRRGRTVRARAFSPGAHRCPASCGTIEWEEGTKIGYVPQKLDIERDLPITGGDFLHAKAIVSRASKLTLPLCWDSWGSKPESAGKPSGRCREAIPAVAGCGRAGRTPNGLATRRAHLRVDEPGQDTINHTLDRLRAERGLTILFISHESECRVSVRHQCAVSVARACVLRRPRTILTPSSFRSYTARPSAYHVHHDLRP